MSTPPKSRSSFADHLPSLLALSLGLLLSLGLWLAVTANRSETTRLASNSRPRERLVYVGMVLPELPVLLDDNAVPLGSLVPNGGVIAFVTTTCEYCRASLPMFSRLDEETSVLGLPFYAISLHDPERTRAFVSTHKIAWPVLAVVNPGASLDVIDAIPLTVVVSASGVLAHVEYGLITETTLNRILAASQSLIDHAVSK